jgi:hypothetical protein
MHAAAVEQIAYLEQHSQLSQASHEEGFTTQVNKMKNHSFDKKI